MKKLKTFFAWLWHKFSGFWPWYRNLYRGKAWYTKTAIGLVSCIVAFILYLGAVDINFLWLFGKSPGYFSGIMNPQTSEASEIYSADGKLIGKYFNENRTPVTYEEVNPDFFKALVDTEDERFYKHLGIDPIGLFGAVKDALLHHDARGASTITQQLAKNMFRVRSQYSTGLLGKIPVLRILIIKSKEWIIAAKLETVYSKKEIITMYANTVDFGSNSYGIKTAAKTYFNTTPLDMTTDQAAVLVGMLKATTYYNPRSNPENSLARRNVVLYNMVRHGDLSKEKYNELKELPIKLDFKVEENVPETPRKKRNNSVAMFPKEMQSEVRELLDLDDKRTVNRICAILAASPDLLTLNNLLYRHCHDGKQVKELYHKLKPSYQELRKLVNDAK